MNTCFDLTAETCAKAIQPHLESCMADIEKIMPDYLTADSIKPYATITTACSLRRFVKSVGKIKKSAVCEKANFNITRK
jgi:hypothetical protein